MNRYTLGNLGFALSRNLRIIKGSKAYSFAFCTYDLLSDDIGALFTIGCKKQIGKFF